MSKHARKVRALFESALEIASPLAQTTFIEQQCNGHVELKRDVVRLLEGDRASQNHGFLDWSANGQKIACDPNLGRLAGDYRLVQQIGAESTESIGKELAFALKQK